jgi:hypothetical protein
LELTVDPATELNGSGFDQVYFELCHVHGNRSFNNENKHNYVAKSIKKY